MVIDDVGHITVDIVFGGNFFALVNAEDLNLNILPENIKKFSKIGLKIRDFINRNYKITHPSHDHINKVDLVEFYEEYEGDSKHYKNIVIFGEGQVDRSPCGTGTCAKLVSLYAHGEIDINETIIQESVIGTSFKGKIVSAKEDDNGVITVIPEVTGSAFITGYSTFVINPKDPLRYGFRCD